MKKARPGPGFFYFIGGAGGSRTRVQTGNRTAFYMLSFLLVVGGPAAGNWRPTNVVPKGFAACPERAYRSLTMRCLRLGNG